MPKKELPKLLELIYTGQEDNIQLAFDLGKGLGLGYEKIIPPFKELLYYDKPLNAEKALGATIRLFTQDIYYIKKTTRKQLPESLSLLTHVQQLVANHHSLTDLSPEFGKLQRLRYLDLSSNHFTRIPSVLFELENLEYLDLSDNKLEKIPSEIAKLTQLQELNLSFNKLTYLPNEFSKLQKLQLINLEENKISSLYTHFTEFENLGMIDLHKNPLNQEYRDLLHGHLSKDVLFL